VKKDGIRYKGRNENYAGEGRIGTMEREDGDGRRKGKMGYMMQQPLAPAPSPSSESSPRLPFGSM
jgi:hypothetical protein